MKFSYVLAAILVASMFTSVQPAAFAQEAEIDPDLIIADLHFAPSTVEAGWATYSIGYVSIMNGTGHPITAPRDLQVGLNSQNATVVMVPSSVIIPKGSQYAQFDVNVNNFEGETDIIAVFESQILEEKFTVTAIKGLAPEDVRLKINIPTNKTLPNTAIPVSVVLETLNGALLPAPYDVRVSLDYPRSLITVDDNQVVIKKGSYYGMTTLRTLDKLGTGFIKATMLGDLSLTAAANIEVSATLPAKLRIYVFPANITRAESSIDIFVGVLDENNLPTFAVNDIDLTIFSDSNELSQMLRTTAEQGGLVLRKNEFGFYMRQPVFFTGAIGQVEIGVNAAGLRSNSTSITVVDELDTRNPKALDQELTLYAVKFMPTNAKAIAVYQVNAIEHDADDCAAHIAAGAITTAILNTCAAQGKRNLQPIDLLEEGKPYPILTGFIHSREKVTPNLAFTSADTRILQIDDAFRIPLGTSYGTAFILSQQMGMEADQALEFIAGEIEEGELLPGQLFEIPGQLLPGQVIISASLQGIGVASNVTTVVKARTIADTMIFSPTGKDKMVFDKEGYADLFAITVDSNGRPVSSRGVQYILDPLNNVVEIKNGEAFAKFRAHTSSLGTALQRGSATIKASPIGENVLPAWDAQATFNLQTYLGTFVNLTVPIENLIGFSTANPIGVVQLRDSFGNPVVAVTDVVVKLESNNTSVVSVPPSVTVPEGKSFVEFPVRTAGKVGVVTLSAVAEGLIGSQVMMSSFLAEQSAALLQRETIRATVEGGIAVSVAEGTSVLWAIPADLAIVSKDDKAMTYDPETDSYLAHLRFIPKNEGDYPVTVSLVRDGYQTKRISDVIHIEPFLIQLDIFPQDPGTIPWNQTATMQVFVDDSDANSVPNVLLELRAGPNATALTPTTRTDENGSAQVLFRPTSGPMISMTLHASKEGYIDDERVVDIAVSGFKQPGGTLFGLPSWVLYVVIAGAVGGVAVVAMLFLRKPKTLEELEGEEGEEI